MMSEYALNLLYLLHWLLLVILPILFILFAWLFLRWGKKRGFSLSARLFMLAAFSGATVGFNVVLDFLSPYFQFSTENNLIASLSYVFGLGWIVVPIIAFLTMVVATLTGIVTLFVHRRRSSFS